MTRAQVAEARRMELEQLVWANGGTITPAQVVSFAENPDTALHSLFTWDDTEAARQWRESEAQSYMRAVVRLIPRDNAEPLVVRAFVSLSTDRRMDHVYRPITDVLEDDDRRAVLVEDAKREMIALKRKYAHLHELAQVWDAIAEAIDVVVAEAA
jgi:DNA transposition AAA+ family ATPase